jgi:hypothetical protein
MDKVVYILGAGFSAPLGLPVMNDFLMKSKDMYFKDQQKYSHFNKVFDEIREMAVCKNYYETDLFNIEDILSILEMVRLLSKNNLAETFKRYIRDVIQHYTPNSITFIKNFPSNWHGFIFDSSWNPYGYFIGNIQNIGFKRIDVRSQPTCIKKPNCDTYYSIITLNYDLIPEMICKFINEYYDPDREISFAYDIDGVDNQEYNKPYLAKLHGSIEEKKTIIAPTWNKADIKKEIKGAWEIAYKALSEANHIRILGYSLPITDAYVKYLLRSAVIKSSYLKSLDVICLDSNNIVKSRFDEFIKFKYYRYANANISDYLSENYRVYADEGKGDITLNKLESVHEEFMKSSQR